MDEDNIQCSISCCLLSTVESSCRPPLHMLFTMFDSSDHVSSILDVCTISFAWPDCHSVASKRVDTQVAAHCFLALSLAFLALYVRCVDGP